MRREELSEDVVLYCGDALEVLPMLEAGSVDAVVTDPPYNVGLEYASTDDRREDYEQFCTEWLRQSKEVCRGPILFTCGIVNLGMWHRIEKPKWILCWWKPASSKRSPVGFNNWEPILLYGTNIRRKTCDVVRTTEQASLPVRHKTEPIAHPCPKPVEWATKQIETQTGSSATVLDPFMGSGTTGVACVRTGRKFVGVELSPQYFGIARARITKELADRREQLAFGGTA